MRNRPIRQLIAMVVIGSAIGIPIALIIPWFPHLASKQAKDTKTLYDVLLIASIPIFMLVLSTVLVSVWQFRMRPGDENKDGPPIHGNTRLEIVWTALPTLLIIGLCTYAYTVLRSNEATKAGELTVNVTARQFAFEFSYPGSSGKTVVSPVLYLPDNRPVVFKLHSLDVIHSFFVPDFSQKLDAVPGITTTVRVTPERIGTYPVECTELCGAGHSLMRATAYVVSQSAFQAWLAKQPSNGPPPIGTPPPNTDQPGIPGAGSSSAPSSTTGTPSGGGSSATAAGKAAFTSAGCSACHTLSAAGASGTVGPNLDARLKSDCATPASKTARGATLSACIQTAITDPYKYLPSGFRAGIMPSNFGTTLSSAQIQSLVAFLTSAVGG